MVASAEQQIEDHLVIGIGRDLVARDGCPPPGGTFRRLVRNLGRDPVNYSGKSSGRIPGPTLAFATLF
jgi:hypothetical protein